MLDLRSDARRRLLAYYFINPAARLHVRDLAIQLGIDNSNLSKELRRLEVEGLFRSEVSGRQKYFALNPDYPLLGEIRGIVMKTVGRFSTSCGARGMSFCMTIPVLFRRKKRNKRCDLERT